MITYDSGIGRVTGYSLGGRRDIEAGVREVLKTLESWGANNHTYDASFGTDNFDFMLEGVPTLVANQEEANYLANYHAASDTLDKVDMRELKLHTALAALTAWASPTAPNRSASASHAPNWTCSSEKPASISSSNCLVTGMRGKAARAAANASLLDLHSTAPRVTGTY